MQQFKFFVKYDDQPIAYGFHSREEAEAFCFDGTHVVYDDAPVEARSMLNCLAQITDNMEWWTPDYLVSCGGEIHKGYHQDFAMLNGEWLACVDVGHGPVFMRQADLNRLADAHNAIIPSAKFLSLMDEVHQEVLRFLKGARVS